MHVMVVAVADDAGGAERYLDSLYSSLAGRGVTASLVGRLPTSTAFGSVHPIPLGRKWSKASIAMSLRGAVAERAVTLELIDSEPAPDVFHLQYKREQILLTRALARRGRVVWTEHGALPGGPLGLAVKLAYWWSSGAVDAVIAVSPTVRRSIGNLVRDDKVVQIDNRVEPSTRQVLTGTQRKRLRESLGLDDRPTLLWVGQMNPNKLPHLALETLQLWDGNAVMIGDGPLATEFRARTDPKMNGVRLIGRAANVTDWLAAADVLLFTSDGRGEGLPLTLLEADAAGLPIVANQGCGIELIVEKLGGVVAPSSPMALLNSALRQSGSRYAPTYGTLKCWEDWIERHLLVLEGESDR